LVVTWNPNQAIGQVDSVVLTGAWSKEFGTARDHGVAAPTQVVLPAAARATASSVGLKNETG